MANKILLTGAGFSANFDAPLASEMYTLIFDNNGVQLNENLRKLLSDKYDYEEIYQIVMSSEKYNETEKVILNSALKKAYKAVDDRIINRNDLNHTYGELFHNFIFHFSKPYKGSGFIFTLNQDLLIERKFNHYPDNRLGPLELPIMGTSVFQKRWEDPLNDNDKIILPDDFDKLTKDYEQKLDAGQIPLSYVKLHGSQDWYKNNEQTMMIIGHGKSEKIKAEPLLSWYFNLFERQLRIPDTKLLIIGYSFNDEHINKVIAENKSNLSIYIIKPQVQGKFMPELKVKPHGDVIEKRIVKYYPITIIELFPPNGSNPHPCWESIKRDFFEWII